MADLSMDDALRLAGSLVTIGHPYAQAAINATAWDLIQMCKGTLIIDSRPLPPLAQAELLVEAVRNWPEGWPERGGTRKLRDLFREMYGTKDPDFVPIAATELVQRGLLKPTCPECQPDDPYCEYGGFANHKKTKVLLKEYEARWAATRVVEKKPPSNLNVITEEQMQKAIDDEKLRREAQLKKLEEEKDGTCQQD